MCENTKIAAASATTVSAATWGTLFGITAGLCHPAANLGGYATAQMVASSLVGVGGPVVATTVATLGGPIVAGALLVVGTGALIFSAVKLLGRIFR